jgi:hypothetical protein
VTGRTVAYALLAAYMAALALAVKAHSKLPPATVAFWDRIARCETGGNWQMHGGSYEGGVGFYVTTWQWWARELGLLGRYPHANQAPRLVQIRVADYGLRAHRGYWGCNR